MDKKNNQRTLNTRNKIKGVLLGKLGVKDINQLSVREICRDASINRSTFYSHYDDIYDLMRDIERDMEQGISQLFLEPERGMYKPLTEKSLEKLIA